MIFIDPSTYSSRHYAFPHSALLHILLPSSNHSVHTDAENDNWVIKFVKDERFVLVNIGHKRTKENIKISRKEATSRLVIPTVYATTFRGHIAPR